MPFAAKSIPPSTAHVTLRIPVLERAAEGGTTLFTVPAGYLLTESLMAALTERGRPAVWLRLGPEDRDPASLLLSLISGTQRICPDVGAATLAKMRQQPGPIAGWPPLFERLGQELAEALPASSAIVLEHMDNLNDTHLALAQFSLHLLPALPPGIACILSSQLLLPYAALPAHTTFREVNDLRLDARMALALRERADAHLPTSCVNRTLALTEGRAGALGGVFTAAALLGPKLIQQAVERAANSDDLLARVARAWLAAADADALQVLALAMRLEYSHPALIQSAVGNKALPAGPWLQPLADSWTLVRHVWQAPLRMVLRARATPSSSALRRMADYLASQDATEQAVPLYFELGDTESAVQAIAKAADTLMNLGQWETLSGWLGQIPTPMLHAWPWLVYTGGEIAAAQGHADVARRAFAAATTLFIARHDTDGACHSLLAESALAAWRGDQAYAQARALAASTMAEAASLTWHQGWAVWQLGCLAAAAGELDEALVYLNRATSAASAAGDPSMVELFGQVEELALLQRDVHRQREFHRQAYFAAEQAEHEAAERLRLLLSAPSDDILVALMDTHGWSRTPLMLKLPAPESPVETSGSPNRIGLWNRLLATIGLHRWPARPVSSHLPIENRPPSDIPLLSVPAPAGSLSLLSSTVPAPTGSVPAPLAPDAATALARPAETDRIGQSDRAVEPATAPTLRAHLLGTFRVAVNDLPVENWPGGRGRAVFKYLLTHHDQPTPRDVLMDVFWPNAGPEAARNSLNVALHSLRKVLHTAIDVPVIVFQDNAYHLNPDLRLWLDVDEFDRHVHAGRRLEAAGQLTASTAEHELAIGLYQGDFLADDPYEEWPVLTRERLRVAYLDTLDRLSQIYFSQGQYAACATLCQLILARDNCREDAHCLLMRCYSRQGQNHLALRQYQVCLEALRTELEVAPALATTKLYERIRRRERV